MAQEARGSAKLWDRVFDTEPPTKAELGKAVAGAKETYVILRWWKYGQPAVDRVKTTLDMATADAGGVIQGILNSSTSNKTQVTLSAFPYGIPNPERVHVTVNFERDINR